MIMEIISKLSKRSRWHLNEPLHMTTKCVNTLFIWHSSFSFYFYCTSLLVWTFLMRNHCRKKKTIFVHFGMRLHLRKSGKLKRVSIPPIPTALTKRVTDQKDLFEKWKKHKSSHLYIETNLGTNTRANKDQIGLGRHNKDVTRNNISC